MRRNSRDGGAQGTPLVVFWRRNCSFPYQARLALTRGHHFLWGFCFEVCHHWGCGFGTHFGGV